MLIRNHAVIGVLTFLCTIFSAAPTRSVYAAQPDGVPPAVPQITQAINPAQLTPMQNNVPPDVTAAIGTANDLGEVSDSLQLNDMLLLLQRPAEQEQALQEFMAEQTTPGSPNYHNWLTAEQVGQYGPAQSDINTLTGWLQAQGFTVNRVSADGMTIDFSGTAGQVRRTFETEVHNLNVDGVEHIANISVPVIPSALAPAVTGIVSINDFKPHTNFKPKPAYTFGSPATYAVVPADLATIYNLNPLFNASPTAIDGTGQTIVLIEDTNVYKTSDITTFRSTFGLPTATFSTVHPGSCSNPGDKTGDDGEAELDVEWAGAAAPGAILKLASCKNTLTTFGGLLAMQNLNTANDAARLWSLSYGFCEAANGATANAAYKSTYQTAAARGVSVFVSSGDEGAASCDANLSQATHGIGVSGFASTPYNVAVGGTDFGDTYAGDDSTYWGATNTSNYGSALSYINEIPWNDSCASQLLATYFYNHPPTTGTYAGYTVGNGTTYGSGGFCNSQFGESTYTYNRNTYYNFLTTASGSGGPSGCATGSPSMGGVVSGSCAGTAKPSWQAGFLGNPADGVRDIPDVSLFAANGQWRHYYVYCYTGSSNYGGTACTAGNPSVWSGAGGTSFSSPIMAGMQALVNQKNSATGTGNPNSTYYSLAAAEYGVGGSSTCNSTLGNGVASGCIFYDVTQGDMDVNCTGTNNCYLDGATNGVLSTSNSTYQPAYGTQTGWDFATGIGTVNACNLVNNWTGTPGTLACSQAGPATKLAFTVEPNASYASNAPITVAVSVEDASGNVVTTDTSNVSLTLSGGGFGASLSGTTTVAAVTGVATFSNLMVNKVGTAYKLNATDGSLTATASAPFNITVGAPATVTYVTQPAAGSNITAGNAFIVIANVKDSGGNPVSGDNVSLAIGNNPGGSTLSGGGTVATDANGNVTFGSVSLDKVGTGYTLTASDGVAPTATSNSFNIVAGVATQLVFTQDPLDVVQGLTQTQSQVTEEDQFGNVITSDNSSVVNFTVAACGGPVSLGSAAMASGVATLANSAQRFYTVTTGLTANAASSGTFSGTAMSGTFNVTANAGLVFSDGFEGCRL
ncbi:MAG: protease pro-enzyme activation domain-containing protein [Rudaea sp.]